MLHIRSSFTSRVCVCNPAPPPHQSRVSALFCFCYMCNSIIETSGQAVAASLSFIAPLKRKDTVKTWITQFPVWFHLLCPRQHDNVSGKRKSFFPWYQIKTSLRVKWKDKSRIIVFQTESFTQFSCDTDLVTIVSLDKMKIFKLMKCPVFLRILVLRLQNEYWFSESFWASLCKIFTNK